jgi:hypothetical protein
MPRGDEGSKTGGGRGRYLLPKVWACVMVPASSSEVMPKVDSIMWQRNTFRGPLSTAMGLTPTDDDVICMHSHRLSSQVQCCHEFC